MIFYFFYSLNGFSVVNSLVSGLDTVHKQSMIDSIITNGNSYCFNLTNMQPGAHLKEHLIRLPYFVIVTYVGQCGIIFSSGIFVALALRFDVSRGRKSQYFKSAFLGYTFGLVLTIVVMNWFQAAQVTTA